MARTPDIMVARAATVRARTACCLTGDRTPYPCSKTMRTTNEFRSGSFRAPIATVEVM